MASSSSKTLANTMEWVSKLNFGRRSAIGNQLEPAITSANLTLQTLLGPPFSWRWNRVVTGFVTTPGQQDYTLLNWQASLSVKVGWVTVDAAGNCQRVTTAGTTGANLPNFNATKGGVTVDNGVVWTNVGSIGLPVSQNFSFNWIETASVQDTVNSQLKWFEITTDLCLASDSAQARPRYISAQGDDGSGAITFRLMPVPDQSYPVAITVQQKPPVFKSTGQTWAPVPDEYSRLYEWGFLSLMWLFADDPRFSLANQKFVTQILSAAEGLNETQRNIFLQGWSQVTGQSIANADRMQQGFQARAV